MQQHLPLLKKILLIIGGFLIVGFLSQWFNLNWGRLELGQPSTLSVTGQADELHANQVATFYASITVSDVDREVAVESINTQMTDLIDQLKRFGIPEEDLQTENLSVYEYTEPSNEIRPMTGVMYPVPDDGTGIKKWQATNSVTITLRDLSLSTDLATLLTSTSGVTISGPNFTTDDTTDLDRALLESAMQDAREKADMLLSGTGQKVLRIVNIYENDYGTPYVYRDAAMSAMGSEQAVTPMEPGAETIYKSVTVVFEISR